MRLLFGILISDIDFSSFQWVWWKWMWNCLLKTFKTGKFLQIKKFRSQNYIEKKNNLNNNKLLQLRKIKSTYPQKKENLPPPKPIYLFKKKTKLV